ncbi:conserved Plasmodium protein, unknown function [Plasmodium sp. DRC-Itaito]|nr:conserved Plasmodium protein, unknown function [Plasmodium sp. DRC-Itaito]
MERKKRKKDTYDEKSDDIDSLNEIDRELFGEDELKILEKGYKEVSEDKEEDNDYYIDKEILNVTNNDDFIHLDDIYESDNITSEDKSVSSDVEIIEIDSEVSSNEKDMKKKKKRNLKNNDKKKNDSNNDNIKNNYSLNKKSDDDIPNESKLFSVDELRKFKDMRYKNVQKRIEENKLITFLLCWICHLYFLNNICNNKLLQGLIYSVYANYKGTKKLYKDPIYLFLFIKNYFELTIDRKSWIIGDKILSQYFKGSIIFRLIRCIHRRKGNNVLLNLIFVSLCRCLNIPSRICMSLPMLKDEIYSIDNNDHFIKKCYHKYSEEFNQNIFFNDFMNNIETYSSDKENILNNEEGHINNYMNNENKNNSNNKNNNNNNYYYHNDDVIIIEKEDFILNKKKKSLKNYKTHETTQYHIFAECYSSSFNKWVSFFFPFNVYYFNFFNFSKNDNTNNYESKIFHILLPLPKTSEEIKIYKSEKTKNNLNKFPHSLFYKKNKKVKEYISEQSSDQSSLLSIYSYDENDKKEKHQKDKYINNNVQESVCIQKADNMFKKTDMSSNKNIEPTQDNNYIINKDLVRRKKKTNNNNYTSSNILKETKYHITSHPFFNQDLKLNKLDNKKYSHKNFHILCENYKGKMYIEKNNKFFIYDKKKKNILRIIYLQYNIKKNDDTKRKNKNHINDNSKFDSFHNIHDNIFDFEEDEEHMNIKNSLVDIYSTNDTKKFLLNQIIELKNANKKLKKEYNNNISNHLIEYDEIIYDKFGDISKLNSYENKYIKVFINSNVYKYFYNLDHYNLYLSINKYNILKDISVRHKLRCSTNSNKSNTINAIIKGDKQCNIIRESFRKLCFYTNKKYYNNLELLIDKRDEDYLYNLYVTNMIPKEKTDFLKSNYYILKSMLKKNQVIYPNKPVGLFKGENVYLKENFYNLTRREYLENKHYYLSDSEEPLNYEYDEYNKIKIPLYAQFQLKKRINRNRKYENCLLSLGPNEIISNDTTQNNNDINNNLLGMDEQHFDYIYDKKDKLDILKNKLFAHIKANTIIELNEDDICIYNIQLKYILKHIKGIIPYKLIYNNSYFLYNKFRKRQNVKVDVNKIIIRKKDFISFQNLYVPPKKTQDEFLIRDKTKQIKNLWKVLFKSVMYEQKNKQLSIQKKKAKNIYKMKDFNMDVDRYFEI